MTPAGVIFPILLPRISANHRLPSGPRVIPAGSLLGVDEIGYSLIVIWAEQATASCQQHPYRTQMVLSHRIGLPAIAYFKTSPVEYITLFMFARFFFQVFWKPNQLD